MGRVRLEDGHEAAGVHLAGRGQVRGDGGRVVCVVVDDPDAFRERERLEAAARSLEGGDGLAGGLVGDAAARGQSPGPRRRSEA